MRRGRSRRELPLTAEIFLRLPWQLECGGGARRGPVRPTAAGRRRCREWAAALSGIRRRGPRWRPRLKVMHAAAAAVSLAHLGARSRSVLRFFCKRATHGRKTLRAHLLLQVDSGCDGRDSFWYSSADRRRFCFISVLHFDLLRNPRSIDAF